MGSLEVPGSLAALLELRLGEQDCPAMGFAAHVPHYLSETAYPDAALALLGQAGPAAGLVLPTDGRLAQSAQATRRQIETQIAQSQEAQEVVARLEEQYEQWINQRSLTLRPEVPSADEIGAEVEEFLKGLDRPDEQ